MIKPLQIHRRILDERAPSTLARWLTRAATCTDLAEVFTEGLILAEPGPRR